MTERLLRLRNRAIASAIYHGSNLLAVRSDRMLIALTRLAERLVGKDYYVREIRRIRRMFQEGHPSFLAAKRILRNTHPRQRRKLIECFIINQLLMGTNKRKAFSESPGGFYPPGFPVVSPTMRCNLDCYGCYSGSYVKAEGLSFEVLDRIFTEAKEMGMYFAVISGGEPFLSPHFLRIVEKHNDIAFHVFTNGTMFTPELLERLLRAGNVLPAISVEGYSRETDARRGKGHYERVIRVMNMLKDAGFLFGFSVTMTRENADVVLGDDFVDFLIDLGAVLGWYFTYIPVGKDPKVELMPTPEQRERLRQRIAEFRRTKPMFFGDFWNDGPIVGGCIASGRKYFHINAQGDIEPCVFFHYATHNIHTSTLKEALQAPLFKKIREMQRTNTNLLTPCALVDKPEIARTAIATSGARPTHPGAEALYTELAPEIDHYAEGWCAIADRTWAAMPKTRAERIAMEEGAATPDLELPPKPDQDATPMDAEALAGDSSRQGT
jgi:MoaA/NifB/PqqE/SkfB family radical SAM enzyme